MNNEIIKFISSGKLGFLTIDVNKKEVESKIGLASKFSKRKKGIEIWVYNDLQISFDKDKLIFIGIYLRNQEISLPSKLFSKTTLEILDTSLSSFIRLLKNEQINFAEYAPLTFERQICLRAESGVHIYFQENTLNSLQISEATINS